MASGPCGCGGAIIFGMAGILRAMAGAAFCVCLAAGQPIRQPNSYGYRFEGPALKLQCVALLKSAGAGFSEAVRAKAPEGRRACLGQLLESLTPEPDFTTADFQAALARNLNRNLIPEDPQLAQRMGDRIGVNLAVAKALRELAGTQLIGDTAALGPLIRCLEHPLLDVSRLCEDTLIDLTHHSYGWRFYYDRPPPPTEEARRKFVGEWRDWQAQMKNGHPIFDEWLAGQSADAVRRVVDALSRTLGGIAASYLGGPGGVPRLGGSLMPVFNYGVGSFIAANWSARETVQAVGIRLYRPGIEPDQVPPITGLPFPELPPEQVYDERFPALDLEMRVDLETADAKLRATAFAAVREALDGLRKANANPNPARGPLE